MRFIENTTWEKVFDGWRGREANDPGWINCATKIKGWPNWESWRRFTADQFDAENLDWQIFEIDNPIVEMPAMLVGPFIGWQSRLPLKNKSTFEDLVNIKEQRELLSKNEKIISMTKKFSEPTELIGFLKGDSDKIVCFDGYHRCATAALAKFNKIKLEFKINPKIAIAVIEDINVFDRVLERGSSRNKNRGI